MENVPREKPSDDLSVKDPILASIIDRAGAVKVAEWNKPILGNGWDEDTETVEMWMLPGNVTTRYFIIVCSKNGMEWQYFGMSPSVVADKYAMLSYYCGVEYQRAPAVAQEVKNESSGVPTNLSSGRSGGDNPSNSEGEEVRAEGDPTRTGEDERAEDS